MSISNILGVLIIDVMDGSEQRIRGKIAASQYDFRDTEAVRHWRKVHNREMQYRRK